MKNFRCDHCNQLVFFENVQCVNCKRKLAYLQDRSDVGSLDPIDDKHWRSPRKTASGDVYRLCQNYSEQNVCNWAIPESDPEPYCRACKLNLVVPDLSVPANKLPWFRIETAKRRLVYTLIALKLPLKNKKEDPERGLGFRFMADEVDKDGKKKPVLTGHANGEITINIAEADEVEREKRRVSMREPYRTLLGHFRHEIGHYYWDRLILDSDRIDKFRDLFGDERADYGEALKAYYKEGAPDDWHEHFISAYSTAHPWEDWAETWAHFLHMTDVLETAAECGLSLQPKRQDEPSMEPLPKGKVATRDFDWMIESWIPVTYLLNNLNRGLGQPDGYPFVLSSPVIEKLHFIHETVHMATLPLKAHVLAAYA